MLNVCRYQRYRIFSHSGTCWTIPISATSSAGSRKAAAIRKTIAVWYAWPCGVRTTKSCATAEAQLASLQEAVAQLADDQDAAAQEAALHEALDQDASAFAAEAQLAESKTGAPVAGLLVMNLSSARFGLGGLVSSIERPAFTSPTPSDMLEAFGSGFAPSISAPLTWSGVYSGCLPRIRAATPLTIGAAKDVPES